MVIIIKKIYIIAIILLLILVNYETTITEYNYSNNETKNTVINDEKITVNTEILNIENNNILLKVKISNMNNNRITNIKLTSYINDLNNFYISNLNNKDINISNNDNEVICSIPLIESNSSKSFNYIIYTNDNLNNITLFNKSDIEYIYQNDTILETKYNNMAKILVNYKTINKYNLNIIIPLILLLSLLLLLRIINTHPNKFIKI